MSTSGLVGSLLRILSVWLTVLPPVVGESATVILRLFFGANTPPPDDESGAESPAVPVTSSGPVPMFLTLSCFDLGCLGLPFKVIGLVEAEILPADGVAVAVGVAVGVDVAVAVGGGVEVAVGVGVTDCTSSKAPMSQAGP